jgi:hypothetical protein
MTAMTEAAESLLAQLNSQGKLTMPRRKNREIQHENEILKAAPYLKELQIYWKTLKNIPQNLVRLTL